MLITEYVPNKRTRSVLLIPSWQHQLGVEGSAADLCKIAMVAIGRRLGTERREARMLLQIHDELLFEAPPGEVDAVCALVREEMEGVHPLHVPL